ncbi:MAG: prolyl oligopeptidase family serine peptidase [Candidatus Aminicenantes bacterium]|nr:prolyl oligopeptidase family serine peptidase [Candidatus Aminicenantes bacterium]
MRRIGKCFLVIWAVFFLVLSVSWTQQKKPLTHEVYDSWKSIYGSEISADGNWILYLETPQDGDAEVVVVKLSGVKELRHTIGYSGEGTDSERAADAQFSYDSSHVVFIISPSQEEVEKAKDKKEKKNKKPKKRLGILDLSNGETKVIERVKSFNLPEEAGGWVAYLMEAPEEKEEQKEKEKGEEKEEEPQEEQEEEKEDKKKEYGTPLVLHSLADGSETVLDSVLNYRFTKDAEYLIYSVSSEDKPETDGVYILKAGQEDSMPLLTGEGNFKKWTMDEEETRLAFLTDRDDYDAEEPTFNLYGWNVGDDQASLWVSHTSTPGFPEGMAVSDKSDVSFTKDGWMVMFGIKEIPEPKKDEENSEEEKAQFDLWHWNDPLPQPQQKKMADEVRNNTWESVYHLKSNKFVKLADEDIPDVRISENGKIAFGQTIWPYAKRISYFGSFYDVYVVDPHTGEKTLVKEELYHNARLSPGAKYVYWFEDKDWHVYDIASGRTKNVTKDIEVPFDRQDWDTPSPPYPYGVAGWTEGDSSILIYDQFDIWQIEPDSTEVRLITEGFGRENNLSFRYVRLDPEEETIDAKEKLLFRVTDEETMARGFYSDRVQGKKRPQKLIMEDKYFGYPEKAENSDTLMLSRMAFDEFPDVWISDMSFSNLQKITDLGRQMEPYIWGKAELRDFKSSDGMPLKGILIKPDDFDPDKKYPLMVYIYETLHNGIHYFRNPSPGTSINMPYYVSNGYVIWMPDIEYHTGYPGKDALKCVLPGIHMLIREGYIDPDSIGIQGHSWGGYQISYMITQTNIFAAAEGGAPVSNMVSAYNGIRWGSGMVRQFQYEHTQSRLGGSLWEYPFRYIENSPIFWADKIQTPIMFMHNDEDGAVPWYQGIEFIMALRRLQKEAYMFNYNGEPHGLRKRVNQKDWTIRMQQFFDHYLKDAPKPGWMKNGIKAWDKEKD